MIKKLNLFGKRKNKISMEKDFNLFKGLKWDLKKRR